ncbi:life-span regulatory factor domain-containing protein [Sarocladium implicatum]|nr:life-span regulatory factor domain-containing protein [Sarocladium implicatum]
MAFEDVWAHQYCLTCDKQVQVDGAAYCSEACRLAEAERSSTPSSQASSPGFTPSAWTTPATTMSPASRQPGRFFLSPAYDFTNAQPYGSTPARQSYFITDYSMSTVSSRSRPAARSLTPSSSQASLCSLQSTSSTEQNQLSDTARKELQAYAATFEQVRLARRRSH